MFGGQVEGRGNDATRIEGVVEKGEWGRSYRCR
jgi:hypothetical protein